MRGVLVSAFARFVACLSGSRSVRHLGQAVRHLGHALHELCDAVERTDVFGREFEGFLKSNLPTKGSLQPLVDLFHNAAARFRLLELD